MAKRPLPTPELLRQLFDYDPDTGILTWRPRPASMFRNGSEKVQSAWNDRYAGRPALIGIDNCGYHQGPIFSRYVKAHRVVIALQTGKWPDQEVDHMNGDRRDNRLCNLREVSHRENLKNCHISRRNKSGATGVYWNKTIGKWQAQIRLNGKTKTIGTFKDKQDAINARRAAEVEYGYGPSHGTERQSLDRYIKKSLRL